MKKVILQFIGIAISTVALAQSNPDTIIAYNIATHAIDTILPVAYNSNTQLDSTGFSIGSLGNRVALNQTPPTTNLIAGTNFSRLAKATNFYSIASYPIRTTAKIYAYKNGIAQPLGSGTMVSSNMMLIGGLNIYDYTHKVWFDCDSLIVYPSFNNDSQYPSFPISKATKAYIFKTLFDAKALDNVALLQLEKHIGNEIGYVGIAFNNDTAFYTHKVFHKFSYPDYTFIDTTTNIYNGDTMFYDYGYIEANSSLGSIYNYTVNGGHGKVGQSGSTFLYTNNISRYYCFGLSTYSSNYNHYSIKPPAFYQLKNIIDTHLYENVNDITTKTSFAIYPNPTTGVFKLNNIQKYKGGTLTITSITGETVFTENITSQNTEINIQHLGTGIYIVELSNNNQTQRVKLIKN